MKIKNNLTAKHYLVPILFAISIIIIMAGNMHSYSSDYYNLDDKYLRGTEIVSLYKQVTKSKDVMTINNGSLVFSTKDTDFKLLIEKGSDYYIIPNSVYKVNCSQDDSGKWTLSCAIY